MPYSGIEILLLVAIAPLVVFMAAGVAGALLMFAGYFVFGAVIIPWWWVAYWVSGKRLPLPPTERSRWSNPCCKYSGSKKCRCGSTSLQAKTFGN